MVKVKAAKDIMAIAYQDFTPTMLKEGLLESVYEDLPAVMARANQWLAESKVKVLNVETVAGLKTPETLIDVRNQSGISQYRFIRVWYLI